MPPLTPYKDPITQILYPSIEAFEAEKKVKAQGRIPTTERIRTAIEAPEVAPIVAVPKPSDIELLRTQIEDVTKKVTGKAELLAKAKAWMEETGATGREQIPDWVVAAESPEDIAKLIKSQKVKELEDLAFAAPGKSYEDIFKEAYDTAGLGQVKEKIDLLDKRILGLKQGLYDEEASITANPWLSESGRTGRIRTLYEMAQKDIDLLVDQRKNLTDEYNVGVTSAGKAAEGTLAGLESQRKLYKAELDYLTRTEKGEELLSVAEAKTLGLPYGTTKAEAMARGIVPEDTAKSWTEFSDVEKRKLVAANINWTTPEGFIAATEYLYPPAKDEEFTDFTDQEKRRLEARGIDWRTPEGRQEALDFLYPLTDDEKEKILNDAQTQWADTIEPARKTVREAYEKELLGQSGFSLGEVAKILLMPWTGLPRLLFGKPVPKFDEAEYQRRLKEVNADDVTIKAWLEGTGITFKDEKLIGTEEGFGIPGL